MPPLKLVVLGDSIAYGQGAAQAADTVGGRLVARLASTGIAAELRVYAVPGARSDALAGQVRRALGSSPDVAVIIIGANDLTHFVPPAQAADQLGQAVRALVAAGAQVVVAPAPDFSVVPWVPPQMRAIVRSGSMLLRQAQASAALAAGARVADMDGGTTSAFAADAGLFSTDQFHPSSAGYAVIADALAPAVLAAVEDVGNRSA